MKAACVPEGFPKEPIPVEKRRDSCRPSGCEVQSLSSNTGCYNGLDTTL